MELPIVHKAVRERRLEVIANLIKDDGAGIHQEDDFGNSPLHVACHLHSLEIVNYLLDQGADANFRNNSGQTPLMYAVINSEDTAIPEALVTHGADINAQDMDDLTAAHYAAVVGNIFVLEFLVENGATMTRDKFGLEPQELCYLMRNQPLDILFMSKIFRNWLFPRLTVDFEINY